MCLGMKKHAGRSAFDDELITNAFDAWNTGERFLRELLFVVAPHVAAQFDLAVPDRPLQPSSTVQQPQEQGTLKPFVHRMRLVREVLLGHELAPKGGSDERP